jgi:hypothetical protein
LETILRDFVAHRQSLPGVRSGDDDMPWPSSQDLRQAPAGSVNNGGDYVACRRALLHRYGTRWLLALHDRDSTLYVKIVYNFCTETAQNGNSAILKTQSKESAAVF